MTSRQRPQQPPAPPPLQERYALEILRVAESCVGQKELPGNRGPFVEMVLRFVGIGDPAPWCTASACWILQQAAAAVGAVDDTCPDYASGAKLWRWALANPDKCTLILSGADLMPGDVVIKGSTPAKAKRIRRGSLASGHTWIARSRSLNAKGSHGTYEGNTSRAGVREGDGFYKRMRDFDSPLVVGGMRFRAIERAVA